MKHGMSFLIGAMAIFTCAAIGIKETHANDYPNKTIRMVVPWAAGGGTDAIARALASGMEPIAGVSVIVDNISGASGATGSLNVVQAKPDGYTILLNGSSDLTALLTFQNLPFSLDDFSYIGGVITTPTWMISHRDRGYESFDDFLRRAKEQPEELTIGVGGAVGAHSLMAHVIKGHTGIDVRIIPYQGGAALNKALLANEVDAGVIHSPILLNEVREGMMKVLVSGGPLTGISYEPVRQTKTLKDYGIPVEVGITRGIFVSKNTPEEVVTRLTEIVKAAVDSDAFVSFGKKFGFEPRWHDAKQFEELVRTELATFREIREKYIQK